MSKFTPELRLALKRMLLGEDPTAPRLSDLVRMWLEENVNDKEVVDVSPSSELFVRLGSTDSDVWEIKLNRIKIGRVLNTLAMIELHWLRFLPSGGAHAEYNGLIPAADPQLFEKLWEHIAEVEKRINCRDFSLIEKLKPKPGAAPEPYDPYPAFRDGAN